ncbi:alcohol dehydrogenase catalytic domain-containing protein [Sinomonas sp. P47F7]|uniref:alcohol dehydrogenase catalytic domain-containing protein n=1 Tax=Sinomonas sp. P47F7 TaxID=3410987 RepID=UPI003BF4FBF2
MSASPVQPQEAAVRKVRGAVLERIGGERPYATSRPIAVRELDLEAPGPGEVLLKIEAAGICHSDLSVVDGTRPRPVPMLLGHEAAGRVVECGPGVEGLELGQRVVLTFLPRCGECRECRTEGRLPCSRGSQSNAAGTLLSGGTRLSSHGTPVAHHLGVSGFAAHAVVDRRSLVPVGSDVPPEIAALLGCAVLTGGGALLNPGHATPEASVAVVGLGGVGMAGLLTALAIGCRRVVAVDSAPHKLELAAAWGAHDCLAPAEAEEQGVQADLVLEAAGHPRAFETAYRLVGVGGTLVTVGLPAPGATSQIEPLALTAGARAVVGSYLGSAVPERDIPVFESMWREGRLPLERLVSGRIGLDQVNEGMDALADGTALRQVILF